MRRSQFFLTQIYLCFLRLQTLFLLLDLLRRSHRGIVYEVEVEAQLGRTVFGDACLCCEVGHQIVLLCKVPSYQVFGQGLLSEDHECLCVLDDGPKLSVQCLDDYTQDCRTGDLIQLKIQVLAHQFPQRAESKLLRKGIIDLLHQKVEELQCLLQKQLAMGCVMRSCASFLHGMSAPMYGVLIDRDI